MPAYRSMPLLLAQFACDKPGCDERLAFLSSSLSEARITAELWHEWSTTAIRLTADRGGKRVAVLCPGHVDYRGKTGRDPYPSFGTYPPYTDHERVAIRALVEGSRGMDITRPQPTGSSSERVGGR